MVVLRWHWVMNVLHFPCCTAPYGCPGTFSMWWTQWWWKGKKTTSPAATLPAWSDPIPSSWPHPCPLYTRAPQRTVPLSPRRRWGCRLSTFMVKSIFKLQCVWLKFLKRFEYGLNVARFSIENAQTHSNNSSRCYLPLTTASLTRYKQPNLPFSLPLSLDWIEVSPQILSHKLLLNNADKLWGHTAWRSHASEFGLLSIWLKSVSKSPKCSLMFWSYYIDLQSVWNLLQTSDYSIKREQLKVFFVWLVVFWCFFVFNHCDQFGNGNKHNFIPEPEFHVLNILYAVSRLILSTEYQQTPAAPVT